MNRKYIEKYTNAIASSSFQVPTLDLNFLEEFDAPVPTMDINFLSGSLDPRITFTRASSGSYFDAAGVMQTASSNEPRFDHDPVTHEPRGLLIEGQRTNLVTQSADFSNAVWVKDDVTVTIDSATAPDGTLSMDKIVPSSIYAQHRVKYNYALIGSRTYTSSLFVKAAGLTSVGFLVYEFTPAAVRAQGGFNLLTETISSTSGPGFVGMTVTKVATGIYRVSFTWTSSATPGNSVFMVYPGSASCTNTTGNSVDGVYAWGGQIEAGAFPTSYIPTTSAAVTRSADVAVMTGTNFSSWFNQSAGTIVWEGDLQLAASTFPRAYQIGTTTSDQDEYRLRGDGSSSGAYAVVAVGGVNLAVLPLTGLSPGVTFRHAFAYALNDFATSLNGGAVQTDTSGTIPAPTQLAIGSNGYIRRFRYFPIRLPNYDLVLASQ